MIFNGEVVLLTFSVTLRVVAEFSMHKSSSLGMAQYTSL